MKVQLKSLSLMLVATLMFVGCGNDPKEKLVVASSKLSRDLNPAVSESQLKNLSEDNNAFAFDIFAKLQENEHKNIFISPYSISQALAMTYAGAKGVTKNQMTQTLHFNQNDDDLHSSFNALDLHLNYTEGNYTFSVVNALWAQKGYKFLDNYLDLLKVNYGADVNLLNFAEGEKSRQIINSWVGDKTHQKIKDLIPKGALNAETKFVLTNAIYFKGDWLNEFEKENTKKGDFTLLDESRKEVDFMHQTDYFPYADDENYQAIELPYKGNRTSMVVVLPKDGKFQDVASDIKNVYQKVISDKNQTRINLKMPKFKFTTDVYRLKEYFKKLGMVEPFSDEADFSGMTGEPKLKIKEILHKAFIKVDEKGSEAAAATAVIMNAASATGPTEPIKTINMFINRAFLFFIRDIKSGQVLFMGIVKDPQK